MCPDNSGGSHYSFTIFKEMAAMTTKRTVTKLKDAYNE